MAVCFKCGTIKFGAFVPCPECSSFPQTEEELALSLAMTDHYFDMATLKSMGQSVREGKPPNLDPKTRKALLETLRRSGIIEQLQTMRSDKDAAPEPAEPAPPPQKKPWWRFW
jgi:hypothetical protein